MGNEYDYKKFKDVYARNRKYFTDDSINDSVYARMEWDVPIHISANESWHELLDIPDIPVTSPRPMDYFFGVENLDEFIDRHRELKLNKIFQNSSYSTALTDDDNEEKQSKKTEVDLDAFDKDFKEYEKYKLNYENGTDQYKQGLEIIAQEKGFDTVDKYLRDKYHIDKYLSKSADKKTSDNSEDKQNMQLSNKDENNTASPVKTDDLKTSSNDSAAVAAAYDDDNELEDTFNATSDSMEINDVNKNNHDNVDKNDNGKKPGIKEPQSDENQGLVANFKNKRKAAIASGEYEDGFLGRLQFTANAASKFVNDIDEGIVNGVSNLGGKLKEKGKKLKDSLIDKFSPGYEIAQKKKNEQLEAQAADLKEKQDKAEQQALDQEAEAEEKILAFEAEQQALEMEDKDKQNNPEKYVVSPWAKNLIREVSKIMCGHPYGFAGKREAQKAQKIFEKLLEANSFGSIKDKNLSRLVQTYNAMLSKQGDDLGPNIDELRLISSNEDALDLPNQDKKPVPKDVDTPVNAMVNRLMVLRKFVFLDELETAINKTLDEIYYSSKNAGNLLNLSRKERDTMTVLSSFLRSEYADSRSKFPSNCYHYQFRALKAIIDQDKKYDDSDYDHDTGDANAPLTNNYIYYLISFFALTIPYTSKILFKNTSKFDCPTAIEADVRDIKRISMYYISNLDNDGGKKLKFAVGENIKHFDEPANFGSDFNKFIKIMKRISNNKDIKYDNENFDKLLDVLERVRTTGKVDNVSYWLGEFKKILGDNSIAGVKFDDRELNKLAKKLAKSSTVYQKFANKKVEDANLDKKNDMTKSAVSK